MLANFVTTTESVHSSDQVRVNKILLNSVLGAFGEVRMCVHKESGAQRAVKVLKKSSMDKEEEKMLYNEINILRNLVIIFSILSNDIKIGPSQYCEDVRIFPR